MTPKPGSNPWFVWPKSNPQARVRLFCIPYAGGGPQIFHKWPESLPYTIEVCSISAPGRGRRLAESPYTQLIPLATDLARNMAGIIQGPFALFGHSMGAFVAYEVARQLWIERRLSPVHLFVSGAFAPHIPDHHRLHQLPDDAFIKAIRELNGMPEQVLASDELMQLVLPALRADFTVAETYTRAADLPLSCPITAFGGESDPIAVRHEIEPWRAHTSASFSLHMLPGDHFFLHSAQDQVLRVISATLA